MTSQKTWKEGTYENGNGGNLAVKRIPVFFAHPQYQEWIFPSIFSVPLGIQIMLC